MGRPSLSRSLDLWANGLRVGRWRIPTRGAMELTYDPTWVGSPYGRPISLSLPMNLDGQPLRGERVGFYFDNLLPDSDAIRKRVRARFHTPSGDAFDLLAAVGRDCVGALQLLPDGQVPDDVSRVTATPLSDPEVETLLRASVSPAGQFALDDDDFRISIAGAQEKTAFTFHDGRWCKPHGATPTTHIFKLPLGLVGGRRMDMRASLENEWLCARILGAFGVPIASSELRTFGSTQALVVARFDRALDAKGSCWLRLPQEDFCQATATPSSRKYEADGGPGLPELARILRGSESADADLATLFRAQLLFWMLAAIDGHAKNFSIHLLPQGRYRLTPLYDVLSAWPIAGVRHDQLHPNKLKLAMAVRGKSKHYHLREIDRGHFLQMADASGLGSDAMSAIVEDVLARTDAVIDSVGSSLPAPFPAEIFDRISAGLRQSARVLAA